MCKRKVREMIELVENDMEQLNVARAGDEKENGLLLILSLMMLRRQITLLIVCQY